MKKIERKMSVSRDEKSVNSVITTYKVIDSNERYSLLDVNIETGRTHQTRVHMKHIG